MIPSLSLSCPCTRAYRRHVHQLLVVSHAFFPSHTAQQYISMTYQYSQLANIPVPIVPMLLLTETRLAPHRSTFIPLSSDFTHHSLPQYTARLQPPHLSRRPLRLAGPFSAPQLPQVLPRCAVRARGCAGMPGLPKVGVALGVALESVSLSP